MRVKPRGRGPQAPTSIPLVPGRPLLGNAVELSGDLRAYLTRCYREHGAVFRVRVPGHEYVVIAGLAANRFMTSRGRTHLRTREIWERLDAELGVERTTISVDGPDHAELRKLETRGFSRPFLDERLDAALASLEASVRGWAAGSTVRLSVLAREVVTDQLAAVCASTTSRGHLDEVARFTRTVLMTTVTSQRPGLWRRLPGYVRARTLLGRLSQSILDEHRTDPPSACGRPRDLVDDFLAAQAADPVRYRDENLRGLTLGIHIAGLDTAASTLGFLMHDLLSHPDVLRQVRAEVDAALADGVVSPGRLAAAPLLGWCVQETMRLHPIAPALTRHVAEGFDFEGHHVPTGSTLMVAVSVPHGLPEIWTEPERYDPWRFSPERSEHRVAGAYAPFGRGAHVCLGSGMAEGIIALNAAVLLRCFDLALEEAGPPRLRHAPTPRIDDGVRVRVVAVRHDLPRAEPAPSADAAVG